jgi:hypothetical protein
MAAGDEDPLPHPVASKATESNAPTTGTADRLMSAMLSTRHSDAAEGLLSQWCHGPALSAYRASVRCPLPPDGGAIRSSP